MGADVFCGASGIGRVREVASPPRQPGAALLGGEVVVDYSLRLKTELGEGNTWIAGYSNDVMAYIPSERVLKEGGYEGAGAMVYYGLPSPWSEEVEEAIIRTVDRLADATKPKT